MTTDYSVHGTAHVTPSTRGLDLNLGSLSVNAAMARNTAYAGTEFEKSVGGNNSVIEGKVSLQTLGDALTEARVLTAALAVSGLKAGANLARSDLSMTQAAAMRVGGWLEVNGAVDIQSLIRKAQNGDVNAKAIAAVSPITGAKSGYSIALGEFSTSKAVARENMNNTAALVGGASGVEKRMAKVEMGNYVAEEFEDYDYELVDAITYSVTHGGETYVIPESKGTEWQVRKQILEHFAYANLPYDDQEMETLSTMMSLREESFDVLSEMRFYSLGLGNTASEVNVWSNVEGYQKNRLRYINAIAACENIAQKENESDRDYYDRVIAALSAADNEKLQEYACCIATSEVDPGNFFDCEETPVYRKTKQVRSVWKSNEVDMLVEVPIYDIAANQMTMGSLNIYSGGATGSEARTDGAKSFGGILAGSLLSDASSTDRIYAMVEGVKFDTTGDIVIKAESNTQASSVGSKPGGVSAVDLGSSDVKSSVGTNENKQTVGVVIGDSVRMESNQGSIIIDAVNRGSTESALVKGTGVTLGNIKSSSIPTESWYATLISFGTGLYINANKELIVRTDDEPAAKSVVRGSSIGIGMNFNTMMGKNLIRQENNIDFGSNAALGSTEGQVLVEARQATIAQAETVNDGAGLLEGSHAQAYNEIHRVARVNLRNASIFNFKSSQVTVRAISGEGDDIYTRTATNGSGVLSVSKATAKAVVDTNAEINVGSGSSIRGTGGTTLEAIATSYRSKGADANTRGIETIAHVDALGLVAVPNAVARNDLEFDTYIRINDLTGQGTGRSYIGNGGSTKILAENAGLTAIADALAKGEGGFGVSNATAWNETYLENAIVVDDATIHVGKGEEILLRATNGETGADRTHLIAKSHAALNNIAGKVAPTSRISGTQVNQIRSSDTSKVYFVGDDNKVFHIAASPGDAIWDEVQASYDRNEITINLLFTKVTLTLTTADVVRDAKWYVHNRCDFCGHGQAVDVVPTSQDTVEERYKDAYEAALTDIDLIRAMAQNLPIDPNALIGARLAKGLLPLTYLNTLVSRPSVVMKARYGVEDRTEMDKLYVLDVESMLARDVRLDAQALSRYRIWVSTASQDDVYLLPNAARLSIDGTMLRYVSDVLTGQMVDGRVHDMDVITALTAEARNHPMIPIGRDGQLDMESGVFTIPQQAEMELYLREISAKWLTENLESGFIRMLAVEPEDVRRYLDDEDDDLPTGAVKEGLVAENLDTEDETCAWKMYWIGDSLETAAADDTPLVFLLVNEETDEVIAYRTTREELGSGVYPTPVGMYLFRDSESDRKEEEKYNAIFFDTPDGEESMVEILTDAATGRELEMPRPIRVTLRVFWLEGADSPVYSICDHLYVMCDGTDGEVSLFGGLYQVAFDGDVFDSSYTRIEGIRSGELTVTLKKDQPVWPEWTGEDTATDVGGIDWTRIGDKWMKIEDAVSMEETRMDDAA